MIVKYKPWTVQLAEAWRNDPVATSKKLDRLVGRLRLDGSCTRRWLQHEYDNLAGAVAREKKKIAQ